MPADRNMGGPLVTLRDKEVVMKEAIESKAKAFIRVYISQTIPCTMRLDHYIHLYVYLGNSGCDY